MFSKSQKSDIINPVAKWTFYDYVEGGQNPIENWYGELSDAGRFGFDALLKDRAKTDNHLEWGLKPLQGEAKKLGVWELKFIADKKQYRILGVFEASKRAVLLIGCYHKGKVYTPPNALDTACKRAKKLTANKAGMCERKIKNNL